MAICNDPRITYLNHLGYNVIKLPRTDIHPLDVLVRDNGQIDDIGELDTIWKSAVPAPQPAPPADAVNINGSHTDNLKLSMGLDILASLLSAMGAKTPKVGASYKRAHSLQFTFVNVQIVRIPPLEVGKYLAHGDLDLPNPFSTYFLDHDKQAFVITELLKANSIKVTAKDDHDTGITVDLPNLKQLVGVNVSVAASGANGSEITYQGKEMLAFGFKAYGISHAGGAWTIHGEAAQGGMAYLGAHEPKGIVLQSGLMSSLPRLTHRVAELAH